MFRKILPLFLASAGLVSPAHAQGAAQGDGHELRAALDEILMDAAAANLPASVDLRPKMPPVGRQTMNDCAAWAFGYYARSYIEARNQQWTPKEDSLIFSPSFIYNQVNGGKDEGSNPVKVLELLRDQGASTLETFPYAPKDHLVQPPAVARAEAPVFRIEDFGMVQSGAQMRALLARGEVVVVGVRTNPIFSAGRYSVYDTAAHERGRAMRTAGQPHGYHAMAIAGYDDARQAFLFMNSWGKDWGDGGAVWVHYDVAESFNLSSGTENLVDYGLVMYDSRTFLDRSDGRWSEIELDDMKLGVRATFDGVNSDAERIFRLHLDLVGPASASKYITQVNYERVVDGKVVDAAMTKGARFGGFYRNLFTTETEGVMRATVTDKRGEITVLEGAFTIDTSSLRSMRLEQIDAYFGKHRDSGEDHWRWTLLPRLSPRDWADLTEIVWEVPDEQRGHRTLATYTHDGSTNPSFDKDSQAALTGIGAGPTEGRARLRFADGTNHTLAFPMRPFTSPVLDGPELSFVRRDEGQYHDQLWSHFEARLVYPECLHPYVSGGVFRIDGLRPDGGGLVLIGEQSIWPRPRDVAVAGYACRNLLVRGDLDLKITSLGNLQYVDLASVFGKAPGGGWFTYADIGGRWTTLDLDSPKFDVDWEDRYVGPVEGVPTWEIIAYMFENHGSSYGLPEWTWPEDVEYLGEVETEGSWLTGHKLRATGPFEVSATLESYEDDSTASVSARISPRSPQSGAISLVAEHGSQEQMETPEGHGEKTFVTTHVHGPLQELGRITSMSVLSPSLAGGWIDGTAERESVGDYDLEGLLAGRLLAPPANVPVRARVTFEDGSTSLLAAQPRGFSPYPITEELVLGALERPWGIEGGRPTWLIEVSLQGHASILGQVQSMSLTATREDGTTESLQAPKPGDVLEVHSSVPLRFDAMVEFDPATGREPLALQSHATLRTAFTDQPLVARVRTAGAEEFTFDPNSWEDPMAMEEPETYATLHLIGWERDLRSISHVEYVEVDNEAKRFVDDYEPTTSVVADRRGGSQGAFSHTFSFLSPDFEFTPTVHFSDGRPPARLSPVVVNGSIYRPELGARSRVQHWGHAPDGKPTWLMQCDADLSLSGFRTNHVRYYFDDGNNAAVLVEDAPVGPWPISEPLERGRRFLVSQVLPGLPAEVVTANVPDLVFAPRFAIESYHPGQIPELGRRSLKVEEERVARMPASAPTRALELVVAPFPGSSPDGLQHIELRGPLSDTAHIARVLYTIERDGAQITVNPFTVDGNGHERFDARLVGPAPAAVTAQLMDANGKVLRTLHWTR